MLEREDILLLKNILSIENNEINDELLYSVLTVTKEFPDFASDLFDSFSTNQFKSKNKVLSMIDNLNILNKNSEVVIFGSWYGSILIPRLANKVKRLTCIDLNERVLKIAKNRLFYNFNNIDYIPADVFEKDRERYWSTDLFINTSCEHMPSMEKWPYWPNSTHFVFTSNNMYNIEGHINCVDNIEQFKEQLPNNSTVLEEDEIMDARGFRFFLAGRIGS